MEVLHRFDSSSHHHTACHVAIRAACRIVSQIEQLQFKSDVSLPPHATLHFGPIEIGLFGAHPGLFDCVGPTVDQVI